MLIFDHFITFYNTFPQDSKVK